MRFIVAAASTLLAGRAFALGYGADPAQSKLEFTGVQAGAEFKGIFKKFTADVEFAPETLSTAKIDVTIDMASEDSKDGDRDKTIRSSDIFDVAKNPTSHYVTKAITKTATGFAATGSLTLRGVTKDVPMTFTFTPGSSAAKLEGSAQLKRLDFGVGQGDWKSTEWIGDLVKVNFSLSLKPKG